jgi:hypothetical protein
VIKTSKDDLTEEMRLKNGSKCKENLEVPRLSRQRRIGQLAHRTQRMIRLSTGI